MSKQNSTSSSFFGWKGVIIATICAAAFLAILYLAIGNEPDYMPSQKMKKQQEMQEQMQKQGMQMDHSKMDHTQMDGMQMQGMPMASSESQPSH